MREKKTKFSKKANDLKYGTRYFVVVPQATGLGSVAERSGQAQ